MRLIDGLLCLGALVALWCVLNAPAGCEREAGVDVGRYNQGDLWALYVKMPPEPGK